MPAPVLSHRAQVSGFLPSRSGTRPIRVHNLVNKAGASSFSDVVKEAKFSDWLASQGAEHATDIAGLSAMALSSADKIRSQNHPEDPNASRMGGDTGRSLLDLGGLGVMAAPTIAALQKIRQGQGGPHLAGGGGRAANLINLAGLGALAVPVADRIQARLRGGEDKQFLSDRTHEMLEVGGLGALGAGVAREHMGGRLDATSAKRLGLGYGVLAAPSAMALASGGHEQPTPPPAPMDPNNPVPPPAHVPGAPSLWDRAKPYTELAGLGLLAAPSLAHLGGH